MYIHHAVKSLIIINYARSRITECGLSCAGVKETGTASVYYLGSVAIKDFSHVSTVKECDYRSVANVSSSAWSGEHGVWNRTVSVTEYLHFRLVLTF